MTLIELLTVMFFVLQIATALGVAKSSHAGVLGYTLAILLATAVAVAWIITVYNVLGHFGTRLAETPSDKRLNRLLGLAAFGCLLWEVLGVAFSGWLTDAVFTCLRKATARQRVRSR